MLIKQIDSFQDSSINISIYQSQHEKAVMLYLHGGGLLLGQRDDLEAEYIALLNDSGYTLITIDYPLAPQVSCHTILTTLVNTINNILLSLPHQLPFYLFGRSAGAYLALSVTQKLLAKPKGVISFYGYTNPVLKEFITPSPFYANYPKISIPELPQDVVFSRTQSHLLPLYIYARQSGEWANLIGAYHLPDEWQLSEDDFLTFPPTFLTACVYDPDVPYSQSSVLNRLIPQTQLHTLFEKTHTFDNDVTLGMPIYQKLVSWLNEQH